MSMFSRLKIFVCSAFISTMYVSCGIEDGSHYFHQYDDPDFSDGMDVKISSTVYYLPVTCDEDAIQMQGSGLCNGMILTYTGEELPAFVTPPPERAHSITGMLNVRGCKRELLEPFQTFASALTYNVTLYVPELDSKNITYIDMYKDGSDKIVKVKKTVTHDGCLRSMDTGSAFINPNSQYYRGAPEPEKVPIDLYVGLSPNLKILPTFTDKRILHQGVYVHEKCKNFNWNLPVVSLETIEEDTNVYDLPEDKDLINL